MDIFKTVCFTAHRPSKLNKYQCDDWVRDRLANVIDRAYKAGFYKFICGGALGGDWMAEEEVIQFSQVRKDIELILALPFEGYNAKWGIELIERFELEIEANADKVVYVCEPPYAAWKMHKRNEWMIDRGNALVAVWDDSLDGGTHSAVQYARLKIPIYQINPRTKKEGWM